MANNKDFIVKNGLTVGNNITVSGTVDGRNISTDGSKLDGIEVGATADQTASEILTLIKTVDGSGSGLDADTLDGIQSASFSTNNYITNHYTTNNYIQTFVAAEVAGIVDSAPAALDTLNELAAALGNNANFSTTVSNQIGLRATNTYVNSTFSSNNYVTGNFVSNNYLTAGQISNINVSQLQVGEEDSAAGGLLTVYGRQTGDTVGGEIRLHTAADYDTNIPYYAIKTSGEDFIIELNGGTDVITIDYSSGAVDIPSGVLEVGAGDSQYGIIHVHGDHTGSSLGGFVRIYSPADYDSTINYYNIKVYQDDFIMEKSDGVNIFTYYGNNGETRFDNPAYVSIGTPDSWYGDLRLHGNGTGSISGGILRFYTAADYDSTIDFFNMKVTQDDWHFERGTGEDIISYFGSNDELRLGPATAYVSVGASDSSKGSLYLWSDGAGSVNGGELRIYNAPDHDTNVNYYSLYAESGDFLISYGSNDYLKYDESASQWSMPQSGGLDVTGNITTTGYTQAEGFVGSGGTGTHILAPHGAHYATLSASVTGAIKVTLPQSWTNTMLRFTVKVYEYATGESFDIVCAGYNYSSTSAWFSTSAYILGDPSVSRNFNVRFGHDGSKCCVYIGETSSTWSYPQVMVSEFYAGYQNYDIDDWNDNWDISFATSLGTITSTLSNNEIGRYVDNNVVWHAGNDGSGSGLDADLLDGIHASGLVSNNYFQDNAGGATGGGSDKIFYHNDQTVTTSYSIPSGQNSMTAGPITINSGVTVTVPSGSEWTIV